MANDAGTIVAQSLVDSSHSDSPRLPRHELAERLLLNPPLDAKAASASDDSSIPSSPRVVEIETEPVADAYAPSPIPPPEAPDLMAPTDSHHPGAPRASLAAPTLSLIHI